MYKEPEKTKTDRKSRGPLDGFLEAFYRPPTGAGIRERKPPRIQRLQRQVEHQPLDSLSELEHVRILSPRQRIFSGKERESGNSGERGIFSMYISVYFRMYE